MVYVGHHKVVGVVVRIRYDGREQRVAIRLYQDHSMFVPKVGLANLVEGKLSIGDPVVKSGRALFIELGPGKFAVLANPPFSTFWC